LHFSINRDDPACPLTHNRYPFIGYDEPMKPAGPVCPLADADMRVSVSTVPIWAAPVAAFILAFAPSAFAQPPASPKPAVPFDAVPAIADAFKSRPLVALGETHGHRERQDFLLNLIADPRFAAVANDLVVEGGSSTHQALMDRFVSGEDLPQESLQRVWRDTPEHVVKVIRART
jgi:hypothetical protein